MNKQELIKKIKLSSISDPKYSRNIMMVPDVLDLVEQLDEPQKPVIQQFVADLVNWTNKMQLRAK